MRLLSTLTLLLAVTGATASSQAPAGQSAADIASALQRKYDTVRDFSADFVHRHESVLKRKREERGTLLVKKPGKMRWEYKAPEEKLFVSNGVRMYQYSKGDNSVVEGPAPDDDEAAVALLAGRGNITRDFNVSLADGAAAESWTLRLVPKTPSTTYDWLEVVADRATLRIQGLTVGEKQGNRSTFVFANFKENSGLADKQFEFSIPPKAQVTHVGPAKR